MIQASTNIPRWKLASLNDLPLLFLLAVLFFVVRLSNFLLFHSLIEISIAAISFCAFAFVWNSRQFEHGYLLLVGLSAGAQGALSVLHALAYKGMGVFAVGGPNLAAQIWICDRYLLAFTVLIAPLCLNRRVPLVPAVSAILLFTVGLLSLILFGYFPDCFVPEAGGLTHFKIYSEYFTCAALLGSLAQTYRRRRAFAGSVPRFLYAYFIFEVLSSLVFTSYLSVYDWSNTTGHFLLLLASYAFYKAVVEAGILQPIDQLLQELKEAVRTRDEFLSIASHELKTPLTPLKLQLQGFLRLVRRSGEAGIPAERAQRTAELCNQQVDRLAYLVDNLLDVSRISSGQLRLHKEPTDLAELGRDVLQRYTTDFQAAGLEVNASFPAEPITAQVDAVRIDQVLTNLLTNAVKYAPGSRVSTGVREEAGEVLLWVEDDGPGIPAEKRARVFERFERALPSTHVAGLGLGLYISRQIVEAHGGRLTLSSELGRGSRFELRLPN